MILDHMQFFEDFDVETGKRILSATYQTIAKAECEKTYQDMLDEFFGK